MEQEQECIPRTACSEKVGSCIIGSRMSIAVGCIRQLSDNCYTLTNFRSSLMSGLDETQTRLFLGLVKLELNCLKNLVWKVKQSTNRRTHMNIHIEM